jgi:hypothetical protein
MASPGAAGSSCLPQVGYARAVRFQASPSVMPRTPFRVPPHLEGLTLRQRGEILDLPFQRRSQPQLVTFRVSELLEFRMHVLGTFFAAGTRGRFRGLRVWGFSFKQPAIAWSSVVVGW